MNFLIRLLNMSFTGGIVILAVLILRLMLQRAPKVISYSLWIVVLFRLLCPVSFSLPVSLAEMLGARSEGQGLVYYIPEDILHGNSAPEALAQTKSGAGDGVGETEIEAEGVGVDRIQGMKNGAPAMKNAAQALILPAGIVWVAGAWGSFLYGVFSLFMFHKKLKGAVQTGELSGRGRLSVPIYEKGGLETSFVMGIFRPVIYLPRGLSEEERSYILLHEQIHIKRFDHLIRLISFFTLCIHWFNPLVWAAFFLSGRDMEMSCDEAVIRRLGSGVKREYSASLLNLATGKRIIGGAPLAFGEGDTGSRIRNVLKYHKPRIAVICGAGIIAALAAVLLLANPMKTPDAENPGGQESGQPEDMENQGMNDRPGGPENQGGSGESKNVGNQVGESRPGDTGNQSADGGPGEEGNLTGDVQPGNGKAQSGKDNDSGDKTPPTAEELRAAMRSMSRGEGFTWKCLKDMVAERNTDLQDYAGYDGAEWDDMGNDPGVLNRYLIYRLTDEESGEDYRVMISYMVGDNEENQINMLYLVRESDQSVLTPYLGENYGGWQDVNIDDFVSNIPKLSDWIAEYQFSSEYLGDLTDVYLEADNFSAMVGDYGGQAFWYVGKERASTPPEDWVPAEWSAAATISRADGEKFVFVEGALAEVADYRNHCERVTEPEALSGCEEQTVIYKMNCDLVTAAMLWEAEEAGDPIPESEQTVDIWYVCVGKEGSPYGYIATLNCRYFTEEDAVSFARSLKFTPGAWEQ